MGPLRSNVSNEMIIPKGPRSFLITFEIPAIFVSGLTLMIDDSDISYVYGT